MDLLEKSNLNKSAVDVAVDILNKKSILDEYRMSGIIESVEIKSELYRSRNELLDSKRKQRFLQIVVGVLMLISGLIVISYRNKKRHSEQIAIINEQENQIAQVELKNKEAELVNLSTFALSKNDMLVNIVKDLDYHATLLNTKEDQKSLKPLKKKIQNFIDDGLNWEDYKVQFTNVYPNFVDSLISFNKEISNNDIKLCCYLKMNMNTKDIAQLFGLTVRAIENKRYRLRKKLKLETETSLMTFINGLN
jgi:DNA-binding CsgD family transcriptional regulator